MIRDLIIKTPYNPGERLPRSVKLQKCLMSRGRWYVKRYHAGDQRVGGSTPGCRYLCSDNSGSQNTDSPDANVCNDAGLLSCYRRGSYWRATSPSLPLAGYPRRYRQNASGIATGRAELASSAPGSSESGDMQFHLALPKQRITACWWSCSVSPGSAGKQSNVDPVAQPSG